VGGYFPSLFPNFSFALIQTYDSVTENLGALFSYVYQDQDRKYSMHFESITAVDGGYFCAALFFSSETGEKGGYAYIPVISPGVFGNATWGVPGE
jgi:hypothetical protein